MNLRLAMGCVFRGIEAGPHRRRARSQVNRTEFPGLNLVCLLLGKHFPRNGSFHYATYV
jgi:hypothetical protein